MLSAMIALAPSAAAAACTLTASVCPSASTVQYRRRPRMRVGSITMNCTTNDAAGGFQISASSGGGGSQRRMAGGQAGLSYQLYLDPAHSQPWGDGTGDSSVIQGAANGNQSFAIYGRIAAGAETVPGAYSDVLVVTVTY